MGALLIAGNLMASCVAIMAAHCQSKDGAKHQATEDKGTATGPSWAVVS